MVNEVPMLLPVPDHESIEFWEGCKRHELLIRRCTNCKTFRYPPDPGCYNCGSLEGEWVNIRGQGVVYTYTIVTHPTHPATKDKVPYNVIVVELPEAGNIHMVSNLVGCNNEDIYIGMPVEVVFEDVTDEVTLPKFKPLAKGKD